MATEKYTFCRICEPMCPLVAELSDEGRVTKLSPDFGHPCGGIACHKGLSFLDIHNDPDRLNWPQMRTGPRTDRGAGFAETDWNTALADIGDRLKTLRNRYGSNSIAVYVGNPWAFNAAGMVMAARFQDLIGTQMRFSANTQDTANKFLGAGEIYGSTSSCMVPDLYNTDYLLCLGSNPKVSRWTLLSAPNDGLEVVKRIVRRGGKVRFVNPRTVESSTVETGPTLRIKPGTDIYFLAAVLNEIERLKGFDTQLLARYGTHIEELKAFIRLYPARRVAGVTGIGVAAIEEIAIEITRSKSAVVYMATGVNQSRQGMLCHWMVEMINFATGNLGREGGSFKPPGLLERFPRKKQNKPLSTSLGRFELPDPIGVSTLPATLLPGLMENGDIRALVILGGNPLLSLAGGDRVTDGCAKLDLMVAVDIYRNATGELCDYVLPATDWLERMDINLVADGIQSVPYVQYSDALEQPAGGRRNAWWILSRLLQVSGLGSSLGSSLDTGETADDGHETIDGLLAARELSIEKLRALPRHTVMLPERPRGALFEHCLKHTDRKIDCCPASFREAKLFDRCEAIFEELANEPEDSLKLISLRTPYIHNSWFSNVATYRRGRLSSNPLHMCEEDAAARGLHEGDGISVRNAHGCIDTQVCIDNELRRGAVAMSHGFGNTAVPALRVASKNPGANCNLLMPVGADAFEPISHMSWLSAIPVRVEKRTVFDRADVDSQGPLF